MPAQVARGLEQLGAHNPDGYLFLGGRPSAKTERYERLTESGVDQMIRHMAKEAKVSKRIYPHLFRHAYITHAHSKGVKPIVLQSIMGHGSLTMISQVYSHPRDEDMHAAMKTMLT